VIDNLDFETYFNYMFQNVPVRHEFDFHGQKLILETGLLAQQATTSVLATLGGTTVLANVVVGREKSVDYFPLQVIYEEKYYASGKIKDSLFNRREGRPNDNAVLTGRMIDRSLRSLFDTNIRTDIQVIITVLSFDEINSPDCLSVIAASSALGLCGFTQAISDTLETSKIITFGIEKENVTNNYGCSAVIFNPRLQKYGVIKHNDRPYYQLVAGGRENNESNENCIIREAKEEIGLTSYSQIVPLGEVIIANYYNEIKKEHKKSTSQAFLILTDQEIMEETKQESHENYTFSWQESEIILDLLNTEIDTTSDFIKEQFVRGVSKSLQIGVDLISNPELFNKKFSEEYNKTIFKGLISSVKIALGREKNNVNSDIEIAKQNVLNIIENITSTAQLQSSSNQLATLLQSFDSSNASHKEFLEEVSRIFVKKSPQLGIQYKTLLTNIHFNKNNNVDSDGEKQVMFIINPSYQQLQDSKLELVVSGDGDDIMMVECASKIVAESIISEAIIVANTELKTLTQFQREFIDQCKKEL
jgi:8-oxo-dGTP pyrophosphatase MutT (NUDIX family)